MSSGTASLLALLVGGLVAFLATPATGRLALKLGVIDHPSQDPRGHKQHLSPTPYLGGIAIFLGLLAGSLVVFTAAEGIPVQHFVLTIGAGLILGVIGLVDDIRTLPRAVRLTVQVTVAFAAWKAGFGAEPTDSAVLNLTLTIVWIVGITNAFNLLDNMDGVSAGLAGIAAITFALMAWLNELPVLPIIAAALAGACLGFLVHNRHPAKVFMGDAGSLFIGFLVALVGIRLRFDRPVETTLLVPVVVLGLPILDTTLVVLSRVRHRRPVFLGARDHIAHRMVAAGLSTRTAVGLLYWAAICLAWLGVVISYSGVNVALMLSGFVLTMGLFFGGLLWRVPVYLEETETTDPRIVPDIRAIEDLSEAPRESSPTKETEAAPWQATSSGPARVKE